MLKQATPISGGGGNLNYALEQISISKTWVVPKNIKGKVKIRIFGAAGKGGLMGDYFGGGGGGGGGNMAYGEFDLVSGTSYELIVGNGTSSFGNLLSASAGGNGSMTNSSDGAAGCGGSGGSGAGGGGYLTERGGFGIGSYGGNGGIGGFYKSSSSRGNPEKGKNGVNTTSIRNPFLITGVASGGDTKAEYKSGGGGGGYGSNGGNGSDGGGGGGGYGGNGGNCSGRYGGAPTGFACGSSGGLNAYQGSIGVILISYFAKLEVDPVI